MRRSASSPPSVSDAATSAGGRTTNAVGADSGAHVNERSSYGARATCQQRCRPVLHGICSPVARSASGPRGREKATIDLVASLGVEGIKLHLLYLVPGTPLHADAHCVGISQDEYASLAADALERLSPETVILRLTGDPPPGIAPDPPWTGDKQATIGKIVTELRRRGTRQGSRWEARATRA